MSRWFRFYDDAVNDPKVQRLEPKLFKAWINLLCLASKNDGWFPSIDDVAFSLRMSEEEVGQIVDGLISSGLVDEIDGKCCPHNWHERQYRSDSSAERMKRHRDKKRDDPAVTVSDVTSDVTVTVQNRAETEAEQKEDTREAALSSDFDAFWQEWPHKVGKPAAFKAFKSAIKRGATFEVILEGERRYIRDKPPDRPWLNPATFLNQNRWEDQPATVSLIHGKPKSSIIQAADDLCRTIAGFDGPPREVDELRSMPSQNPPRLLSHG